MKKFIVILTILIGTCLHMFADQSETINGQVIKTENGYVILKDDGSYIKVNTGGEHVKSPILADYKIKGYRGSFDVGYTLLIEDYNEITNINLRTTHGYQFNQYFYLGIGSGVDIYTYYGETSVIVPIYADCKVQIPTTSKILPFVDFKVGCGLPQEGNVTFHLNPSVGVTFPISYNFGLYAGIGYMYYKAPDVFYNDYYYYDVPDMHGFQIKVGIEF